MKSLFLILSILFCASLAHGQISSKEIVKVTSDITGASSCLDGKIYYQGTTGKNWERVNGICTRIDGVGGGTGITNTALANTIPVSDGTNLVPANTLAAAPAGFDGQLHRHYN